MPPLRMREAGAGHACYMEQPWLFDRFMIEFLKKNRLFPR